MPMWVPFAVVISITVMLCLSINYRAFTIASSDRLENEQLATKIQSVTDENLQIQEDIHFLKNDPIVIEREAKRLGIAR